MRPALFLIPILLLSAFAAPARALDLREWIFGKKAKPERKVPRVRIAPFTGGTGNSAWQSLCGELMASEEIFPVTKGDEKTPFNVSGESVGGRIVAKLSGEKGKQVFERTYAAPGIDENVKALADDLILAVTGKPGLATSRIAFVSDKSGSRQIYLCDSDGVDVLRLTDHRFGCVSPALGEAASLVAFTTYRTGFPSVAVLDPVSGMERTLTETPGGAHGVAFSSDGQHVALTMGFIGTPEIFVLDLSDGSAACVTETTGVPCSPSWHPDGKSIIYSCDDGSGPLLWIASLSDKSPPARWRTGYSWCTDPEWSPDGKQVAFTARLGSSLGVVIKTYPSGSSRILQASGAQHPTWSPNGRFLAYAQEGRLYIHDIETGQRRQLVKGHGRISEPCWMK